jgi:hypothetical protein
LRPPSRLREPNSRRIRFNANHWTERCKGRSVPARPAPIV